MEDLRQKTDELDALKTRRAKIYARCQKRKDAFEKRKEPDFFDKDLAQVDSFSVGVATICGGFVGASACACCKRLITEYYLSKAENFDKVQDLLSQTGVDSVRDLAIYLLGKDGSARVLYYSSGVRDYLATTTVEVGVLAGVVLGLCASAPALLRKWKIHKYERSKAEVMESIGEYRKVNNECEQLETEIKTIIYNSWNERESTQSTQNESTENNTAKQGDTAKMSR